MLRNVNLLFIAVSCLTFAIVGLTGGAGGQRDSTRAPADNRADALQPHTSPPALSEATPRESAVTSSGPLHPILISKPSGPPRIELAGVDPQGRSGSVACSTCHSVREPNLANISAATLDEFHQGMTFLHGNITCYACHNQEDSDSLRLADGQSLEYQNVMTLCSQCHGPQATAFEHGAHGGMNGYWDLTRGPQMKNNCIDCHDPHVPAYPKMIVGFKAKDRFNTPADTHDEHEGAAAHDQH